MKGRLLYCSFFIEAWTDLLVKEAVVEKGHCIIVVRFIHIKVATPTGLWISYCFLSSVQSGMLMKKCYFWRGLKCMAWVTGLKLLIGTKTKEACIEHYRSAYLNSPYFPLPV
ncbi:ADA2 2B [Perilla frutescens var. hirtella]|uniref:ADA2 2B n=1 Tax=Perilla frutescens var. hirtella TaxID=608512 RepID=A0AAD4ITG4_PERFH|nr:ADA2 2B [Perilla frutescens var. hirtella]